MKNALKLIIWDFDGVIADSEHLWIECWRKLLNQKFKTNWDFKTSNKILGGISPKSKIENLSRLGINIDDSFLKEMKEIEKDAVNHQMVPVEGVEEIFKLRQFKQCIATGGNFDKTEHKLDVLGFRKYFKNEDIFTAQMVERGKPAPDLFLYALEKEGIKPKEAVVVEDSLAGLQAALNANILPIAFVGCQMNNNFEYIQRVKDLGIKHIFDKMGDVKSFLLNLSR